MLKQSTSVIVLIGPVLDSSGVAYTGLAIADLNITKNGSTAAMSGNTFSHSHEGHYLLTLTTTNTNTLGNLVISCNKSTYAMPPARFRVLHANVYDVTFGSTAPSTYAGGDTSGVTTLLSRVTGAVALASALVTAQASLDAINTKTTNLPTDPADQSVIIAATDALLAAINALNNLSAGQVRIELATELGRIDQAISTRSSQSSVDDLPTNAELATALSAADDAMLSAIGAVQSDTNDIQLRLPAALIGGKMDSVASVTLDADDIDDIAAAVIDGLGNQAINIVSPFAVGGALTVFTGDSYLAANNTSLRFNLVGRSDLVGLIPHLIGKCGTSFDLTASAVASGTETMTFSDLTGAVTSLLTPGAGSAPERGEYQIRFYDGSGNKVTETSGIMYVRRGLS